MAGVGTNETPCMQSGSGSAFDQGSGHNRPATHGGSGQENSTGGRSRHTWNRTY